MQHLIDISPVLGVYDAARRAIGNPKKARYASLMTVNALGWNSEQRAGATVLAPSGRIDESTADSFKDFLLAAMAEEPAIAIIDLEGVDYMSSRGLRALTLAQRAGQGAGTTIVLARPNETMREILGISRYDMVFRVADTVEDALGH
ncbi:STAS domain-containing protein [Qipengyuania sp. ASV99]